MMRSFYIVSSVLAIGMMAVSCSKSELEVPNRPGEPNKTSVTVSLGSASAFAPVEAAGTTPKTKSSPELAEGTVDGQIHDLWAIQYDAAGNLVGSPYYTADIPAGTAGTPGSGTDYSYDGLSVKLTSSGADAHTVYFVANTHNGSLFTVDNDVTTLAKLKTATMSFGREYKSSAGGGIVMMGRYAGTVAAGTPLTGVKLERLAAKVVLKYKVNSTLSSFAVTGVQLKNVPATFTFADAPAEDVNFPAVADDSHIDYPAENLSTATTDGDYKQFVWYMPENASRTTTSVEAIGDRTPDKSDGRPAYVEVTGVLKTDGQMRKAVYRILLGDPAKGLGDFNVQRNHIYTVTLDIDGLNVGDNRVTVESYDMSNCAMLVPGSGDEGAVTFDIRKCLNNGFTSAEDLKGMMGSSSTLTADVLWQDGDVINTADVSLDKVNGLLTVRSSKVTAGNAVVALYPDANKAQGTILWSWHIWVTDYRPDEAGIATRAVNTKYDVTGGEVHTYGTQFQKANGTSRVIMDRNLGATKTYYAAPASGDMDAQYAFGMLYQWGRKDPLPFLTSETVDLPTTATASMITIPIYGPDGTTELAEGDRDDATAAGCKRVSINVVGVEPSLSYAVQNPLTFIYNGSAPCWDWYAKAKATQNDALWGDGAPKSAYDPCPKGWRVPPDGTWSDFTRISANAGTFLFYQQGNQIEVDEQRYLTCGRLYVPEDGGNVRVWYPTPGYRSYGSGTKTSLGRNGYSWSSMVSGVDGISLAFHVTWINPSHLLHRAYDFPVRCVQE